MEKHSFELRKNEVTGLAAIWAFEKVGVLCLLQKCLPFG